MGKYVRVMFDDTSSVDSNLKLKIGEVNVSKTWNPKETEDYLMGGFNFSTEDKILRWLSRGDTIYDVIVPSDGEIIECESYASPHGVFRTNKIILVNPRKITDEMAMEFYRISDLPEFSYYKSLAGCSMMGYEKTAMQIIRDKVNKNNILEVLEEFEDFHHPNKRILRINVLVDNKIRKILEKIKNE